MKIFKKMSSIFIVICIILNIFILVSAAPISGGILRKILIQFPIGNPIYYSQSNIPYLEKYPQVVDALSQLLVDVKVDEDDFDFANMDSLANKLYSYRIREDFLKLRSKHIGMVIFMAYASRMSEYKFVSDFKISERKNIYDPLHFCCMIKTINNNGKEKFNFYWIDKERCRETVKKMMDGTFDINENFFWEEVFENDDSDLLFLKYTQNAIIQYFGDIDVFFCNEELSKKFFKTMLETITDNGKSPGNNQKMISIVSSNKLEAVNDYRRLGHDIIKKSLEYIGHEEGKDYELVYDDKTGYIKFIRRIKMRYRCNGCDCY